jgi:hypothetical protein
MPKRRRFATRDELTELLARREPAVDWASALAALEAEGVALDNLVKVVVDEEV